MVRTIILAVMVLFAVGCCSGEKLQNSYMKGRNLYKDLPKDGRFVHYLGQKYKKQDYRKLKQIEIAEFKSYLKRKYNAPFKFRTTKYFNIAYRCSEKRMNHLQHYLLAFFREIYPRFFRYEPLHVCKVIYFENWNAYRRYTGSYAYGFYSPSEITITTHAYSGYGTLWHELIHVFVHENMKQDPQQWFNEGFASFYEFANLFGGRVVDGYTNWRMPYLKRAIRSKRLMHLKDFMKEKWMSGSYGYSAARFLFCYLYMNNVMGDFVKAYIFDLSPRYSGKKLGEMAIKKMESLTGKSINVMHKEYVKLALRLRMNKRLVKVQRGMPISGR